MKRLQIGNYVLLVLTAFIMSFIYAIIIKTREMLSCSLDYTRIQFVKDVFIEANVISILFFLIAIPFYFISSRINLKISPKVEAILEKYNVITILYLLGILFVIWTLFFKPLC